MRRRVGAAIVVVTALAVAMFAIPLGVLLGRYYLNEATLRLERQAILAARQVPTDAPIRSDPAELPTAPAGTALALYDASGQRVAGTGPDHGDAPVQATLTNDIIDTEQSGRLVVAVPVTLDEQVLAVVRAEQSLGGVRSRTVRAWLAMATLALAIVAVGAIVAHFLAVRLAQPVERLRDAARSLGQGDFTVHVAPSSVAEVDEAGRALTATAQRLGTMLDRERAFSADVSHQLRTPVAALRLGLEAELDAPRAEPTLALTEALDEVDRLEATIEELLALAREPNAPAPPLDTGALLVALEARWHGLLAARGRRLTTVVDRPPPRPSVSLSATSQALDVLVDNALRHGRGTVTVESRTVGGGAIISVTDEGAGVEGDPDEVFQRHNPRASGHGIGLALARSLIEGEGGRLLLARPRPHPRFEIVLPARGMPDTG